MRRITLSIRSKRNPDVLIPGYMVLHEIGTEVLTFFSTKKFNHEEALEITAEIHGELKKYEVQLLQCNEQISSGRVMNAVPVDGQPLPTRTFYRCFTKINSLSAVGETTEGEEVAAAPSPVAEVPPPPAEDKPTEAPAAEAA